MEITRKKKTKREDYLKFSNRIDKKQVKKRQESVYKIYSKPKRRSRNAKTKSLYKPTLEKSKNGQNLPDNILA